MITAALWILKYRSFRQRPNYQSGLVFPSSVSFRRRMMAFSSSISSSRSLARLPPVASVDPTIPILQNGLKNATELSVLGVWYIFFISLSIFVLFRSESVRHRYMTDSPCFPLVISRRCLSGVSWGWQITRNEENLILSHALSIWQPHLTAPKMFLVLSGYQGKTSAKFTSPLASFTEIP